MKRRAPPVIPKRRRREGRTDYRERLTLLKGNRPLLVIRRSNTQISAQVVEFSGKGDICKCGIHSRALEKYGWKLSQKSVPAAYLTGYLLGKKCVAAGIKEAILSKGRIPSIPGNKMYACVRGVIDGGIEVPVAEDVFPSQDRIEGKHIASHAKQNPERFNKTQKEALTIGALFSKVKEAITSEHERGSRKA